MPLPPYYLKVILTSRMVCIVAMMMYRGGILQVLFESFSKGPGGFPYVIIITGKGTALEPIYGPTFADHGIFVLGGYQEVLDGATTFEVGLYDILPTDLFNAFAETLCVRYDYMTLTFYFIGSRLGACGALVVTPSNTSLDGLLSLFFTLSRAHLGYLHWVSAFLRWPISLQRSSGLLHTVLAQWMRVLIALNFAERWWLSFCRYWSVWVGFLYTIMNRLPSASSLTIVSKKEMAPSSLLFSTVNWMVRSTLVICHMKSCLLTSFWMTKVSSTYLCQSLGGGGILRAFCSKYSM